MKKITVDQHTFCVVPSSSGLSEGQGRRYRLDRTCRGKGIRTIRGLRATSHVWRHTMAGTTSILGFDLLENNQKHFHYTRYQYCMTQALS